MQEQTAWLCQVLIMCIGSICKLHSHTANIVDQCMCITQSYVAYLAYSVHVVCNAELLNLRLRS